MWYLYSEVYAPSPAPMAQAETTVVHSFSRLIPLLYSAPLTPLNIFLSEEQALINLVSRNPGLRLCF